MDLVSSTIALGAAGAGPSDDYWFSLMFNGTSGEPVNFDNADFDSSGNVILTGDNQQNDHYGTLPNNHKATAHKLDGTDGSTIWHRYAGHQTIYKNSYYFDVCGDDDDNVYISGTRPYIGSGSDAGNQGMAILKYNSSGSLQWQKDVNAKVSGNSWMVSSIVPASSNGKTISAGRDYDSRYTVRLVEMNTDGSVNNDKVYQHSSLGLEPSSYSVLARGSTDNYVYVTGSTSNNKNFVIQVRNNWTYRFITYFDSPTGELQSHGIALDDSDNQYVLAGYESSKMFLYKITRSNQQVSWQKNIANAFDEYRPKSIVCKDDKVYVCGTKQFSISGSNQQCLVVIAFNQSDGSIDSAIRIRNNNTSYNTRGKAIAATDTALAVTAQYYMATLGNPTAGAIFKIPLDFSLTGTYSFGSNEGVVYETWSPTVSTSSQGTSYETSNVTVSDANRLSNGNYTNYNVLFNQVQIDID